MSAERRGVTDAPGERGEGEIGRKSEGPSGCSPRRGPHDVTQRAGPGVDSSGVGRCATFMSSDLRVMATEALPHD